MNNKMFLFNESSQITFLLQLFHRGAEGRVPVCFNATIKLEGNVITMSIEVNTSGNNKRDGLSDILAKTYKKKDFNTHRASIDGQEIKLKINEEIRFTHFYTEKGKCVCSLTLKKFHYTYKGTKRVTTYRLFTNASILLSPYLTGLSITDNGIMETSPTTYEASCYGVPFNMFRDERHVYVQTEGNIDVLLRVLSFFFCNPIEYDMVYSYGEDSCIEVSTAQYSILATKRNEMLGYLFSGEVCLDNMFDFINVVKSCNAISWETIDSYISNYVRAEYLDNISKLLLYSSILEKMAKVGKKQNSYEIIHKYLIGKHIDVNKINAGVNGKGLKNEENEENENIENFVQLRNFFVHHLGSKEAESFLKESDMLFYLKLIITILILKRIGVSEIAFGKNFHDISVFDESVKVEKDNI